MSDISDASTEHSLFALAAPLTIAAAHLAGDDASYR